jgi:MFS family permease
MVGTIGGLIIGGVEAALMTRRSRGRHLGWRRLIWLALATMVCLAFACQRLCWPPRALPSPPSWPRAQSAPASPINHRGVAERCLMLSRVEWVKRTVTWINGRTLPKYSAQERARRCSRHWTLGRRARLEPEE